MDDSDDPAPGISHPNNDKDNNTDTTNADSFASGMIPRSSSLPQTSRKPQVPPEFYNDPDPPPRPFAPGRLTAAEDTGLVETWLDRNGAWLRAYSTRGLARPHPAAWLWGYDSEWYHNLLCSMQLDVMRLAGRRLAAHERVVVLDHASRAVAAASWDRPVFAVATGAAFLAGLREFRFPFFTPRWGPPAGVPTRFSGEFYSTHQSSHHHQHQQHQQHPMSLGMRLRLLARPQAHRWRWPEHPAHRGPLARVAWHMARAGAYGAVGLCVYLAATRDEAAWSLAFRASLEAVENEIELETLGTDMERNLERWSQRDGE